MNITATLDFVVDRFQVNADFVSDFLFVDVIDQVMKNSHCRDPKMEAYCDEVRRLEDKFDGLELNHIARRYNETADELAKIASGRTMVPPDVFSRDLHQPSVKTDDTPEPEKDVLLRNK